MEENRNYEMEEIEVIDTEDDSEEESGGSAALIVGAILAGAVAAKGIEKGCKFLKRKWTEHKQKKDEESKVVAEVDAVEVVDDEKETEEN